MALRAASGHLPRGKSTDGSVGPTSHGLLVTVYNRDIDGRPRGRLNDGVVRSAARLLVDIPRMQPRATRKRPTGSIVPVRRGLRTVPVHQVAMSGQASYHQPTMMVAGVAQKTHQQHFYVPLAQVPSAKLLLERN